jgi:hypothetical protein
MMEPKTLEGLHNKIPNIVIGSTNKSIILSIPICASCKCGTDTSKPRHS